MCANESTELCATSSVCMCHLYVPWNCVHLALSSSVSWNCPTKAASKSPSSCLLSYLLPSPLLQLAKLLMIWSVRYHTPVFFWWEEQHNRHSVWHGMPSINIRKYKDLCLKAHMCSWAFPRRSSLEVYFIKPIKTFEYDTSDSVELGLQLDLTLNWYFCSFLLHISHL